MKKMLNISKELNAAIRVDAMSKSTTANALIIELLEREYSPKGKPVKEKPSAVTTPKVEPQTVTTPKIKNVRQGEVIEEHKQGLYLQRKQHPKGILSNGQSLRKETSEGFIYAYFVEDL